MKALMKLLDKLILDILVKLLGKHEKLLVVIFGDMSKKGDDYHRFR
jgi:hypothetical protein